MSQLTICDQCKAECALGRAFMLTRSAMPGMMHSTASRWDFCSVACLRKWAKAHA